LPVKIPKPPSHPFLEMIWKIFTMIARAFLPLLAALPIQLPLIVQWRKKMKDSHPRGLNRGE